MKLLVSLFTLLLVNLFAFAQSIPLKKLPEYTLPASETEAHLRFIASDELQGRMTGEPGSKVAARYMAEQFRLFGIQPVKGQNSYYQNISFSKKESSGSGKMVVGEDTLTIGKDLVLTSGEALSLKNVPYIYVNYGWTDDKGYDDYKNVDVKGKIVIARWGTPDTAISTKYLGAQFEASKRKEEMAQKNGAVALIEVFTAKISFKRVIRFFGGGIKPKADDLKDDKPMAHCLMDSVFWTKLNSNAAQTASLQIIPAFATVLISPNVVGVLEGSDPKLKNEYVILSAHYDHLGMIHRDPTKPADQDTIFNGARDNGFGCSALLLAAKSLSIQRPRRSILFISFTGEEEGLFGSDYYAKHPLIPLKDCVYAFDTDGAGYNDTTVVTTIGLERTDCSTEIKQSAAAFGLKVIDDPAPEQNLFDRSDNVSFAAQGIPAPDFAPGLTKFDGDILKYYHQLGDQVETVSFTYFHKYCQTFAYAARLIANRDKKPKWRAGDKYEKAYNALYKL